MEPFVITGTIVDCPEDGSWKELRILTDGALVVDGKGQIVHRGSKSELEDLKNKFGVEKIIELENKNEFLLPGFIDSHIHASQYPNCGLGLDLPLLQWLEKYTFPVEARFAQDLQFARLAYEKAVTSTLNHGTTSAAYYATIDVDASMILAETAEKLGQRALVGKVNIDRNGPDYYSETTQDSIGSTKNFVTSVLGMKSELVEPILTPRFSPTCSRELLESLGQLAKEKGLRIQTHLSECKPEVAWVKELEPWAQDYTDVYAKTGILTDKTILAHGVYLSDKELSVIQEYGSAISHCPNSNNSIRSGNMDSIRYHNDFPGLKLGLGTDCSGGYSPSLIDAMRFGVATSNNVLLDTEGSRQKFLDYKGALSLATRGSAKVCGLQDRVGGFDVGLQFDALRVRMSNFHDTELFGFESVEDMIHKFVFLGNDRNLVQIFVNGNCVKNLLSVS